MYHYVNTAEIYINIETAEQLFAINVLTNVYLRFGCIPRNKKGVTSFVVYCTGKYGCVRS